jgi:hypothetical protein
VAQGALAYTDVSCTRQLSPEQVGRLLSIRGVAKDGNDFSELSNGTVQEAEAGRSRVPGLPGLSGETLSPKRKKKKSQI